jgi:hypothetical protein
VFLNSGYRVLLPFKDFHVAGVGEYRGICHDVSIDHSPLLLDYLAIAFLDED